MSNVAKLRGATSKIHVEIDGYKSNKDGNGFALSYLIQANYKDTMPSSAEKAPIKFSIDYAKE